MTKARISLFFYVDRGKKEESENVFFKANRFCLTSKSCSCFNKLAHGRPSIKSTPGKGNDMLLKVDKMYILFRKSWNGNGHSSTDERRGVWSKLLMLFTFNILFICYLGRICKKRVINSIAGKWDSRNPRGPRPQDPIKTQDCMRTHVIVWVPRHLWGPGP